MRSDGSTTATMGGQRSNRPSGGAPPAHLAWLAGAAGLLGGCAAPPTAPPATPSLPAYSAPATGPTARLVMRGTLPAGRVYAVTVYDDPEQCTGVRTIGSGSAGKHPDSTLLAAGRLTTLEFVLVKPGQGACPVRWTFTPQAGRTYLLSGSETAQGCVAGVLDMTDPERIRPDAGARRRNPLGTGARCLPLAQSPLAQLAQAGAAGDDAVLRPNATADDLKGLIEGGR
ncbi:hypothetical protein [Aquabacterium sp. J223]|uniref:hypothetical protein n=1 Tax=Aquabacterium sp. J223 TaxID=2898431 RepID=UPI0021AE24A7|nr:hypothetical protein [Aquabacterium sp. J223]UUX97962.1 hypothetical protein LRS07_17845 [Aquabacterium sp. J223]